MNTLKAFGSLAYASIHRGGKFVFLGYKNFMNDVVLDYVNIKEFFIYRIVTHFEHIFFLSNR